MATNVWTGTGEWNTNLGSWSASVAPTSGQNVDIEGDDALNGTGLGHSLLIGAAGQLTTGAAATLTLGGYLANASFTSKLQGQVSVAGNLVNSGSLTVMAGSAATSVSFANLMQTGTLDIQGGAAQATVTVAGAPTDGFSGEIIVSGKAKLAYAGTAGAFINENGSLELDGAQASVTFAGASALAALSTNLGTLSLRGDTALGAGGVALTTTGQLLSMGSTNIDDVSGSGGSQVNIHGALIIGRGAVTIGNTQLAGATHVTATSLIDNGALIVSGGLTGVNPISTTVTFNSAAPAAWTGSVEVTGYTSAVIFAGSGVTSLQYQSTVQLQSGGALLSNNGSASALAGLNANYGTLDLENDALTIATSLQSFGDLNVDALAPGGGALTVQGTVSNYGVLQLGNPLITANDSMHIAKLVNQGTIFVEGAAGAAVQAKLSIGTAAAANLIGLIDVGGDGDIDYAGGQIANVQSGSELDLFGAAAQITNGSGSALQGLRINYGEIDLRGDESNGQGGVQLSTNGTLRNNGRLNVDNDYGDGGSQIHFGGAISNYTPPFHNIAAIAAAGITPDLGPSQQGGIYIGNVALSANTTVTGTSFLNEGYLDIQGSADDEATLAISGAANAALTGSIVIGGDGALIYGSAGITNIQAGSQLQLIGAHAQVLTNNGSASALAGLSFNFGKLILNGNNTTYGVGGVTVATTGAFTNYSQIYIDDDYLSYGSVLSIGGLFTNDNSINVGPIYSLTPAPSILEAAGLANNASLYIGGASLGEVIVNGAATNSGRVSIAALSSLTVDDGAAYMQNSGETDVSGALSAASVVVNGGKLDFKTALTADDVIGGFSIGAGGNLEFDAAADSGRTVNFAAFAGLLSLNDAVDFAGAISNFGATDFIHLTGLTVTTYAYAGNATAGVLTLQTNGGTVNLHFNGSYAKGNFLLVSDGGGGTYVLRNQFQDIWSGYGYWDASPSDWSTGAPPAGKNVLVSTASSLNATGVDTAGAVTVLNGGTLTAASTSTLTVTNLFNNNGGFYINSNNATIAAALDNGATGFVGLNAVGAGADVSLTAGSLSNFGSIALTGGAAPSGLKAKLSIGGYAPISLTGTYQLENNATIAFGSGAITSISDDSQLDLFGAGAGITSGSGSALSSLAANYGTLDVEGDNVNAAGGGALSVSGAFLNAHVVNVDVNGGGSQVTFGDVFTNTGSFTIGASAMIDDTLVTVGRLNNEGSLQILGDDALIAAASATLKVTGVASAILTGQINLAGAATLEYGSGGIASIQYGATLEMDGANAKFLTNNGAASALASLTTNAGTLNFEGGFYDGAGGVTQNLSSNFNNFSIFEIDAFADGGSAVSVAGTFLNTGETTIGNSGLQAGTTFNVNAFVNQGSLLLQGALDGSAKALMKVTGNATAAFTGQAQISGDAELRFGGGGFTTLQYGASLELDGSSASITAGGVSALQKLTVNAGDLILTGNSFDGAGGVTLTTTASLTNAGLLNIDENAYLGGGDTVTIGGALVNTGDLEIGNSGLADDDLVTVSSLTNEGRIGVTGSDGSVSATLAVTSAASGALAGLISLMGDAKLSYASGGFTSVRSGAQVSIYGSAQILGGASSALATLTTNYGGLYLEGNATFGGAISLAIGQAFGNYGQLTLDGFYGDGGSTLSIAGLFTNDGEFTLGSGGDVGATSFSASGLANNGTVEISGASGAAATLTSSANVVNRGALTVFSGGVLDAGASAIIQYAGEFQVQSGGVVKAGSVDAYGGLTDFAAAVTSGSGLGNFAINGVGTLEFDAGVDSSHIVTFSQSGGVLALGSSSAFGGLIHGFSGDDAIDLLGSSVTSLAYSGNAASGTLNVVTSSGSQALHFGGSYTTASFTTLSDGAGGTKILFV